MDIYPISYFNDYFLSVIYINAFIYFVSTSSLFCVMFIFNTKLVNTLTDLKNNQLLGSLSIFMFVAFLSLAGVPPLLGFAGKFFLFTELLATRNLTTIIMLFLFNMFALYFYIQNLRFFQAKKLPNIFVVKKNRAYIDPNLMLIVLILGLANIFGFFFFNDIVIFYSFVVSLIVY